MKIPSILWMVAILSLCACSGRRLPPGTPPPEYEPPAVSSWTANASAGSPGAADLSGQDNSVEPPSTPPAELSLDAGSR